MSPVADGVVRRLDAARQKWWIFTLLSTAVLAFWLTMLMIAWMRFRGHAWRPTLEMASTSIVALPLLLAAFCAAASLK